MRWEYSFSLGRVGSLERKIVPKSLLEGVVFSDFKKALGELKDYFFIYQEPGDFDSISIWLDKEEVFLKNICSSLVEEDLKIFFEDISRSRKIDSLKDFSLYLELLFEKQNSLRASFFGMKKKEVFLKEKEKMLSFYKDIESFCSEAEKIFKEGKVFLLDFLTGKYILKFWEKRKNFLPLSFNSVIFFFFAKRLNLKVVKFLLFYLFFKLNPEKIKEVIKLVYG